MDMVRKWLWNHEWETDLSLHPVNLCEVSWLKGVVKTQESEPMINDVHRLLKENIADALEN